MVLSKLASLMALASSSYCSRPLLTAHSLGGLVISNKSFRNRRGKRFKSLKSRSNRRKAKRLSRV